MKLIDQRNDVQRFQDDLKETKKLNRKLQLRIETYEKKLELQQLKEQNTMTFVEQLEQKKTEQEKNSSVVVRMREKEMNR